MGEVKRSDEKPVHVVTVAAFQMDRTEVTVAAYEACVSAGICEARSTVAGRLYDDFGGAEADNALCNWGKADHAQHPTNCVDWNDASSYCRWVGKRLPTEEEWKYAARGTDGRTYPWGDNVPKGQLCWNRFKHKVRWGARNKERWGSCSEEKLGTCAVGSFPLGTSPFGLHDMAGNVWEWTSSGYSKNYAASRVADLFVHRGGCWNSYSISPSVVRAAIRGRLEPSGRLNRLGFRCAR